MNSAAVRARESRRSIPIARLAPFTDIAACFGWTTRPICPLAPRPTIGRGAAVPTGATSLSRIASSTCAAISTWMRTHFLTDSGWTNPAGSKTRPRAGALLTHDPEQQGFLGVHAIAGLLEGDALRAVEHGVGDLLAAVGGEAVH